MTRRFAEIQIIDVLLDADPTSATSNWYDVGDFDKVGFVLISDVTNGGAGPTCTYTVQTLTGATGLDSTGQPVGGTARTYDKIVSDAGTDAPVASVAHSADTTDFIALSPEDAIKWVRVVATGANTNGTNTVDVDVFLTGKTAT